MLTRRHFAFGVGAAALWQQSSSFAQNNWPNRPVRVIVNTGAGSGSDASGRLITDHLSKVFGQPFVMDFKPGANGILGSELAVRAPKDGYTLLYTYTAAQVVNPVLYEKLPYDSFKDIVPIAQFGQTGNILVVNPSLPVHNLQEFISYARARPAGELTCGSWGNGSGGHIALEALNLRAKLNIRHVPYKSSPASLTDTIAGHTGLCFAPVAPALPLIQAAKVRPIAVTGTKRVPELPNVGTMSEQGVSFDLDGYYLLMAPAGTPEAIISRVNAEFNRMLQSPDYEKTLKQIGLPAYPIKTPQQVADTIQRDFKGYAEIVRAANIKL